MTLRQEKEIPGADAAALSDADGREVCICPRCERKIRFKTRHAGKEIQCPRCGKSIKLYSTTAPVPYESSRPDRFSSIAGWVTSIALHSLLLLSFTGIKWYSGFGTGSGERNVGIVVETDASINLGRSDALSPMEPSSPDLTAPPLSTSQSNQPIENLGASGPSSPTDLEIEAGSLDGGEAAIAEGNWASLSAGEGGAGGKGASFFGLEARGGKFVYVVDRSSSMRGSRLEATKAELIRSVHSLKRTMEFFIIFYDSTHEPMPAAGLVKATGPNKGRYLSWVEAMGCRGGTDPQQAMLMALSLEPDAIWLLSDGEFDVQACDVIRAANPGARIQIHTIAFHSASGQRVLQRIAEENRGRYRFVRPPAFTMPRGLPPRRRRP